MGPKVDQAGTGRAVTGGSTSPAASSGEALGVIRSREAAARVLQPLRQRILGELQEPQSASGVARRLGLPRQKVNYHLRELERDGLVVLVEERRRGNCAERIVRATARAFLISPEALGALGSPDEIKDRLSAAYLIATAARVVEDLAGMQDAARQAGKRLSTLTLTSEVRFASAATRNAFAEELATTLAALSARYHDEAAPFGRSFRFVVGGYPAPGKGVEHDGGDGGRDPSSGARAAGGGE